MIRSSTFAAALAAVLAAGAAQAQTAAVTGTVVDAATSRPLAAATVTLRADGDSARAVTDAEGRFRMARVAPGTYTLQAARIGYATLTRADVAVPADGTVALGTLELAAATILLDELTVRTEASTTIVAADRTIYSTRDMPVASGGMATDVLRSVPELEVDINGGVQLRGTAVQIHLNGRPAPMQGESLNLFLQQFPADRIERIEVIPNPSARFEAEGAGGIVNIVLKRNVDLGLSGNLFVNAGTRGDAGGGGRLAYQSGPWTLFGGTFLRRSDRTQTSWDLRRNLLAEPVTLLEQDASTDNEGLSGNLDFTAEYEMSARTTLRGEVGMWRNGFDADGVTVYTETREADDDLLRFYDRATLRENRRLTFSAEAGVRHSFAPAERSAGPGGADAAGHGGPGGRRGGFRGGRGGPRGGGGAGGGAGGGVGDHALSIDVEYQDGADDAWSRVEQRNLAAGGDPDLLPFALTLDDQREGEREMQLSVDYARPWGPLGRVEVGYRAEQQDTDESRVRDFFAEGQADAPASTAETGFAFRETFHSAYATVARTLGALSAQVGLRAERADTRLDVAGVDDVYRGDDLGLFPSVNLRYDLGGGRDVRFSYSRRVRRPQPWVLNPTDRSTDPRNRYVGNPALDPQFTHSVSVETSWTGPYGTLRLSPYYRRTVDDWTQIKTVDAQGVSTVTWENLASVESYGTSLTGSFREIGGVSGSVSVSGAREVRDASNLSTDYSGDAMQWSARGNVSARITESLAAQGMFFYRPARDVPQGRVSSTLMTHVGVRYQFLRGRATANLMMTDPLDLYRSDFQTRDATHEQIGRSRFTMRSAVLSISYAFGRPPRDRGQGEQEEEQMEQIIR